MIHYHGTPITPRAKLEQELGGRCFCVSYAEPRDVAVAHRLGQSVMLDCGAYTFWTMGRHPDPDGGWDGYYAWAEEWLDFHTTWAVIPDVIDGGVVENDLLVREWARRGLPRGAPVWHMHEPLGRLERLCGGHGRVCIGSSGAYATIGTDAWHRRMADAMNLICGNGPAPAWIHMLRGMSLSGDVYPFASVDSSDIARHHSLDRRGPRAMADRWDALQNPARWTLHDQGVLDLAADA